MTDVEKRRLKLLHETRKNYSDKYSPPAIHPRYQSTYHSLYKDDFDEQAKTKNTFLFRTVIAILLFALFYVMNYRNEDIGMVNSQTVINEVQRDLFSK